ncbi:MAG: hypothetical protein QOF76_4558 [Solirubrobacteraceae bacterium]|jgi:hypothetical protein|nr:hypothetical protein [Solirubrobacteraceae bacterium]
MRNAIALAATLASAGTLVSTAAAADTVKDCDQEAGPTITITSVRNMTCHRAAIIIVHGKNKTISKHFEPGHGFSCDRISGVRLGGVWRCTKDSTPAKAFRFDFAD